MGIDDGFDITKVPIGKPPTDEQFSKWNEKSRLKRLTYEFVDLNEHPKFLHAVDIVKENINTERSRNGLSKINGGWPEIRFVDKSDWNDISVSIGQFEDTGGFFERESNAIFLVCDIEKFGDDKYENLYNLYGVAHELGHFTIPIEKYSFHLSEAIVDANARKCLTDNAVDILIGSESREVMRQQITEFVANTDLKYDMESIIENDVIAISDSGEVLCAAYISQTRMLNSVLEKVGYDEYSKLIKFAFNGDVEKIKELLLLNFGSRIEKFINDPKADFDISLLASLIKKH